MRQVFLAGKEAQERPPLLRGLIADSPAQHGIAGLDCVEDRALRDRTLNLKFQLLPDVRQRPKMLRKLDSNHGRVCTSTDSTAGRSRTIGFQLSPASAEA